jgi:chromate transporter
MGLSLDAEPLVSPLVSLTLAQLVAIFVRTGSLAFGGGAATLAMLHAEFCLRRPLLSEEEFQLLFGLTRLVPGMNLLSLTVLLGYRSFGLVGALLSLVGLSAPSFTIIILGCLILRQGHPSPALEGAVRGLSIGATALLIHTAWQVCQGMSSHPRPAGRMLWLLLMALAAGLAVSGSLNPAWVVLGGGAAGVVLFRWLAAGTR